MNQWRWNCLVATHVVALLVSASAAFAQTRVIVPLRITDGVNTDTLSFGMYPGAHCCFHPQDSCEAFVPPIPPPGVFDARFVAGQVCPNDSGCFWTGAYCDFRPFIVSTQRDTFNLRGQMGSGTAAIVSWPNDLNRYFIQLTLRYVYLDTVTGDPVVVNVNMLTTFQANITLALQQQLSILTIRSEGLVPSAVEEAPTDVPEEFELLQNHPNPFNSVTHFRFSIPRSHFAVLKVYDLLGREVATLVNEVKPPGIHDVTWNAEGMTSGVYFYRLQTSNNVQTRKLILLK